MAAPSVTLGTAYFSATALSSHTVNLPAGTAYKGVWICTYGASTNTVSGPTGWTLKVTVASTGARKLSLLTSDATTSATSVQVDTSTTTNGSGQGFSTDGNLSAVVTPTGVVSSGTNPDPPASGALTSGDYRIMALCGYFDARRAVTVYPSSYADNQANVKGTLQNEGSLGLATRGMTGITSEDPGTFTLAGSIAWVSATAAIPAATGGPVTGTIGVTQANDTAVFTGSVGGGIAGNIGVTEANDTPSMSGTITGPSYPGGLPSGAIIAMYDARTLGGSDASAVSSWPDSGPLTQSPLAQASSGLRPVIDASGGFGGIRSVKFDGVDDRLEISALASTYTGDFAFIMVKELLTYPTGAAAVFYSCDAIPNKHICGYDDVEDPPGWVIMSSNDGTQAQHHHGTASQSYVEAVPSRFITVQLVRNAGEHKFWENNSLVTSLSDSSGEDSDLNNLTKLKLGCREDNSRHVNGRIAFYMVVDMSVTNEATLLAARDELAPQFNVPGFASSSSGTIAVTQGTQSIVASGTVAPPAVTGTIAVGQDSQTMTASGSRTVPAFTGTVTGADTNDTSAMTGTVIAPVTGTLTGSDASDVGVFTGTVTVSGFAGNLVGVDANDTMVATGTRTLVFTGTLGGADLNDTVVASGKTGQKGTIGTQDTDDLATWSGKVGQKGTLVTVDANDTAVFVGVRTGIPITGIIVRTETNDVADFSGFNGEIQYPTDVTSSVKAGSWRSDTRVAVQPDSSVRP